MKTLYLRNVPDDVVQRLEQLALRDHTSVTAVAVRELSESSRRVENGPLLRALGDQEISTADVVAALDEERAGR